MQRVVYTYNDEGFITGRSVGKSREGRAEPQEEGTLVLSDTIKTRVATTYHDGTEQLEDAIVDAGWSFEMENGIPKQVNGEYVVTPPEYPVNHPDAFSYLIAGMINKGVLSAADFDEPTLNMLNWQMAKAGRPAIVGTVPVNAPVRTIRKR